MFSAFIYNIYLLDSRVGNNIIYLFIRNNISCTILQRTRVPIGTYNTDGFDWLTTYLYIRSFFFIYQFSMDQHRELQQCTYYRKGGPRPLFLTVQVNVTLLGPIPICPHWPIVRDSIRLTRLIPSSPRQVHQGFVE